MDVMKEFISILKHSPNGAYDFICNNYYRMSKEELKDVAKELLFVIHATTTVAEHDKALEYVAIELKDYYSED